MEQAIILISRVLVGSSFGTAFICAIYEILKGV